MPADDTRSSLIEAHSTNTATAKVALRKSAFPDISGSDTPMDVAASHERVPGPDVEQLESISTVTLEDAQVPDEAPLGVWALHIQEVCNPSLQP